jgi:CRISPR-associated protein Csm3
VELFKTLYNRARLEIEIEPVTPLLIKAGDTGGLNVSLPHMQFVRTNTTLGPSVVIPGSSLKGVVRSQAERLLWTDGLKCCDPLDHDTNCGSKVGQGIPVAYPTQCYACRTFGSTKLGGRARFTDLLPWAPGMPPEKKQEAFAAIRTEVRPGVAIDRKSQSVRGRGLYEMEIVTAGTFYGEILLTNFQLWQLGLVGLALRDIDQGYQQLGSGKSRGLGRVHCRVARAVFESFGPLAGTQAAADPNLLRGVGELGGELVRQYDLAPEDRLLPPTGTATVVPGVIGRRLKTDKPEAWNGLLEALLKSPAWSGFKVPGKGRDRV